MQAFLSVLDSFRRSRRRDAAAAVGLALGSLTLVVAGGAAATGADAAPMNTAQPTLTGTAQVGHALTVQSGSWSGTNPIVLSYQWKRCDTGGANCSDIAGATTQIYTLASADVGATLRISVTATNSVGNSQVAVRSERGGERRRRAAERRGTVGFR